jgi:anion-transporting  ArsA/GET3 family ATPase
MTRPGPADAALGAFLQGRRVVACLGAGGVGKTTIAAALAVGLAAAGRRVLCLTIDPARRLADSLGLGPGAAEEVEIPARRLAEAGVAARATLHFAHLDPERTFESVIRRSAPEAAVADRVVRSRLYRYVSASLPGVQEFMAMERLFAARSDPRFDVVVLDTPPTTNALDFLDAPRRVIAAVDSTFTAWLVGGTGGGLAARAGGGGARLVLRALSRMAGPGLLEEIGGVLRDARSLLPGFRARAAELDGALRSPEVAFVPVTSAQPQAIDEVIFVHDRLAAVRSVGDAFVVNRVRPRFVPAAGDAEGPHAPIPAELLRRLHGNLVEHNRGADEDEAEIRRLVRRCGEHHRYYRVPAFATDVRDLAGVAEVSRILFGAGAAVATG